MSAMPFNQIGFVHIAIIKNLPQSTFQPRLEIEFISTLLLKVCNKKQENQAAILIKSSVDAAQNALSMFNNRTPLSVT